MEAEVGNRNRRGIEDRELADSVKLAPEPCVTPVVGMLLKLRITRLPKLPSITAFAREREEAAPASG